MTPAEPTNISRVMSIARLDFMAVTSFLVWVNAKRCAGSQSFDPR
jgi:hypothetical protein